MTYTHKQIVEKFKAWFNAHHFINRVTVGDYDFSQIDKAYPFPHIHLEPNGVNYTGNQIVFGFNLIIMDLIRVEESKQDYILQILSDTEQVLRDFHAYAMKGDEYFNIYTTSVNSIQGDARWDFATQNVAGWQLTFNVQVPDTHDICSIPLGDATPEPPADCRDATIVDDEGNTIATIASGGSLTLTGYRITSSGSYLAPVTSISGGGAVSGDSLENVVAGFNSAPSLSTVAQNIVDGASAALEAELSNLLCGETIIIPALVRPTKPETSTPYRTGDIISQYNTGVFDRLDADRTGRVRVLGADNYTLDANTPNSFNGTARFTFDDPLGTNAWNGTSFDTTYPVGSTDYVIIDHLYDLVWYVANLGGGFTWNAAIDACEAHTNGGYDWRCPSADEIDAFLPDRSSNYYSGGNPFRRSTESGYNEIYIWTSYTDEIVSTNNGFRYSTALETSRRAKTDSTLNSVYPVANYNPT